MGGVEVQLGQARISGVLRHGRKQRPAHAPAPEGLGHVHVDKPRVEIGAAVEIVDHGQLIHAQGLPVLHGHEGLGQPIAPVQGVRQGAADLRGADPVPDAPPGVVPVVD